MDRIPEERVGIILKRAAELDSLTISLDTLRSAALEAGISEDALDRAIGEYEARANAPAPAPKPKAWKSWFKRGVDSAKLFVFSTVVGAVSTTAEFLVPLAAMFWIYFIVNLARKSKDKSAAPFVLANIAITFGLMLGVAAFDGERIAGTVFAFGALTTVVGAAYIQSWLRNLMPQTSEGTTHESPGSN